MAIKIEDLENLTKLTDEETSQINGGAVLTIPPYAIPIDPCPYPYPYPYPYPEPQSGGWFLTGDGSIYQQR